MWNSSPGGATSPQSRPSASAATRAPAERVRPPREPQIEGSVIGGLIASVLGTGSIWELNALAFILAVFAAVLLIGVAEGLTARKTTV